jgi:hypothetical protein
MPLQVHHKTEKTKALYNVTELKIGSMDYSTFYPNSFDGGIENHVWELNWLPKTGAAHFCVY